MDMGNGFALEAEIKFRAAGFVIIGDSAAATGFPPEAIADRAAGSAARSSAATARVVAVADARRFPAEARKFSERRDDIVEILIEIEMIFLDVGDDGIDGRMEVQGSR